MDFTKDVTLKKLIARRIKDNEINVVILCRNAQVRYNTFVMWLNSNKFYAIGHEHFEELLIKRICKQLGITIRTQYLITDMKYDDFKYLRDGKTNRRKAKEEEEVRVLKDAVDKLLSDDEKTA